MAERARPVRARLAFALALALALNGCGYFNTLYNARRQFADAERARLRGDDAAARIAYAATIDKAAKSYRKYPRSRWSDDALFLIARSRFELGEYQAARAAFTELLSRTTDNDMRSAAHAYSGAAALRLASADEALMHLDSAAAHVSSDSELFGFTRLWRARAHAASGNVDAAWQNLDEVTSPRDAEFQSVQLERALLAISRADTSRATSAFAGLMASRDVRSKIDTLAYLAYRAADVFGAEPVRAMLAPRGDWLTPARDSLVLIRAGIAQAHGDTINGNRDLADLAGRAATNTASAARVLLAQSRLRSVR
ncbi:MAG TPA: tetratricopeptide repeat protein, partial [Longimicrobiales bacterium]|nr:tetratricopeptide repeat protein [Longimicrobiales bacterium]